MLGIVENVDFEKKITKNIWRLSRNVVSLRCH